MIAYLGLGSNTGNRRGFLRTGISRIGNLPKTRLTRISSVFETEPYGPVKQRWFLNCVAEISAQLPAARLHAHCRRIERKCGRPRGLRGSERPVRWGPRTLDIDILTYGFQKIRTRGLTVPHPDIANRRFVLAPLAEIAPNLRHPLFKRSWSELLRVCPVKLAIRKVRLARRQEAW